MRSPPPKPGPGRCRCRCRCPARPALPQRPARMRGAAAPAGGGGAAEPAPGSALGLEPLPPTRAPRQRRSRRADRLPSRPPRPGAEALPPLPVLRQAEGTGEPGPCRGGGAEGAAEPPCPRCSPRAFPPQGQSSPVLTRALAGSGIPLSSPLPFAPPGGG